MYILFKGLKWLEMEIDDGQYLPGTASLVESIDKKILVILRDGRIYVGTMRSFDHFANIVLEGTMERVYQGGEYAEHPIGLFLIRGENVVMLGNVDMDKEASTLKQLTKQPFDALKECRPKKEDYYGLDS